MPSSRQSTFIQNNFIIGERRSTDSLSRETFSSLKTLINYRVLKGGAIKRRPGIKVLNEFPNIDLTVEGDIKRFFSLGDGYVVLFNEGRLIYILGDNRFDIGIRPFHSQRYTIEDSALSNPESISYTIGDFALHNVVDNINPIGGDYYKAKDIVEYGERLSLLPVRGLPFLLYIEDNLLIIEPYFFDSVNLDSYDSLIRAFPINNKKHEFKNVLYNNSDIPSGEDENVRIILGQDSDLDGGRCRAWLGATKSKESTTEKIDVNKMALADLIGTPIIFNVFPDTPEPIPLDFKNTVEETEGGDREGTVKIVKERDWNVATTYSTTVLGNLNTALNMADFSFDPTVDSNGAVRGTKATLIRELLFGRRYMIIPFRKHLSTYSEGDIESYSTVYPSSTNTVDAKTEVVIDFDTIDGGEETVADDTISEMEVSNFKLSEDEEAVLEYDSNILSVEFTSSNKVINTVGDDRNGSSLFYYTDSDNYNPIGTNWTGEVNGILPAVQPDSVEIGSENAIADIRSSELRLTFRRVGSGNSRQVLTDVYFRYISSFLIPKSFGNTPLTVSTTVEIFDEDNYQIYNNSTTASTINPVSYDDNYYIVHDYLSVSQLNKVFRSRYEYLNHQLVGREEGAVDVINVGRIKITVRINSQIYDFTFPKDILEEPLQIGGILLRGDLGYETPSISNAIKPIMPEGEIGQGTELSELSWSNAIVETGWKDNFVGAYLEIPRDSAGDLDEVNTKLVLVANPNFTEFSSIGTIELYDVPGIGTLTFSFPIEGDTPNGQEDLTKVFSKIAGSDADLISLVTNISAANENTMPFKIRLKDGNDNPAEITIVDYLVGAIRAIGYNKSQNVNYITVEPSSGGTYEHGTLDAGGSIEGNISSEGLVAVGSHRITTPNGVNYTYFLLIKKGTSFASETTIKLTIDGTETTLVKRTDTGLSEVEEFFNLLPAGTELPDLKGNRTISFTKNNGDDFIFAPSQTSVRNSSVYADCMIFELGMTSPYMDSGVRRIGGANYDNKEVEVRQAYSAYPDSFESIIVFNNNLALLKDDNVHFIYDNDNKANNLIRTLNGIPGDDVKELIIKAGYVPGIFSLGYPTVISEYLQSDSSGIKDTVFNSPGTKTLEDYLDSISLKSVVDYTKKIVDPKGRKVVLKSGAAAFSGNSIYASSDFGLFAVPTKQGDTPFLIHSQNSTFDILVFNNKLSFITPDNLLAIQVQSREREGLRTSFSGRDQTHLLSKVKDIIYDNKRQLYLMNTSDYDIICSTDFDTEAGGFGTWKSEEVEGVKRFKVLKLLSSGLEVKAVCVYRKLNEETNTYEDRLSVVSFEDNQSYDGENNQYMSVARSNVLVNQTLAQDSGLYQGAIGLVEVSYVDCRQIKVKAVADNVQALEYEYIQRDSQGRVGLDVPAPLDFVHTIKGYNPSIEIVQDGLNDIEGFIYGFKMRGSIDGI